LSTYGYILAKRPHGGPVFANESRGSRYYIEEMVVQAVAGRSNLQALKSPYIYMFELYSVLD